MQVVAGVAAAHGLSADTIAAIVAKTDGVPLFVEELTRSVMELAGEDGAVPATLKDLLMARLDRLGGAREVAQIAAVIGRQFSFALLEAVAGKNNDELEACWQSSSLRELCFPRSAALSASFNFKHALVRDAAYESLLLMRRREWHGRVAQALEQLFGDVAANEPELLAYHFGEAGLAALACNYRMRAGDQAVSRSAYAGGDRAFLGRSQARRSLAADRTGCAGNWSSGLISVRRRSSPHGLQSIEAETAYIKASEIGEQLGDGAASFQAKWGLWINANFSRKTALARDRAGELVIARAAIRRSRAVARSLSLPVFDGVFSWRCPRRAGRLPERVVTLYDMDAAPSPGACRLVATIPPFAPTSNAAIRGSCPAKSNRRSAHYSARIALAERLDHPNSLAHGLHNCGIGHQLGGDREATYAAAHRAVGAGGKIRPAAMAREQRSWSRWATAIGAATRTPCG